MDTVASARSTRPFCRVSSHVRSMPMSSLLPAPAPNSTRTILLTKQNVVFVNYAFRNRRDTSVIANSAAVSDQPGSVEVPQLKDIPLYPIVDPQGLILSEADQWTAPAFVYSIYDDKAKLQFVGFSKDLKNSLRTVFSRRPDKAYFFKAQPLPAMDQDAMMAMRDAWFEQVGGAPPGNKLALERAQWTQAVDAGAISQRGKKGAAEDKTRQLMEIFKTRGCKEVFLPNLTLQLDGLVDFMPARTLSDEEVAEQKAAREAAVRATRTSVAVIDGHEQRFQVAYDLKFKTNGGYMFDVVVNLDNRETKHRIIVGKEYYEPYDIAPELVIEAALALLLSLKVSRHTEGVLLSSQYPVNYFSISQLEQWFRDDFRAELAKVIGDVAFDGERDRLFWRFNKTQDYGPMRLESSESLNVALGNGFSV